MESPEIQSRVLAAAISQPRPTRDGAEEWIPSGRPDGHAASVDLHLVEGDAASPAAVPTYRTIPQGGAAVAKRLFDVIGAILIGALFSPFIIGVAILIRLSGQPILFKHRRIGLHGKVFNCLKFRSMSPDAEHSLRELLRQHPELRDEWTENHKLRRDPRVTMLGHFLRRTSLDELPQLWNVLRGEMSLVGPRPVVRAELLRYGRQVSTYLAIKPGVTGLWQVKGRSDTTYRRRVAMDKYYVQARSLRMDLYIVALTAVVVIKRAGAY